MTNLCFHIVMPPGCKLFMCACQSVILFETSFTLQNMFISSSQGSVSVAISSLQLFVNGVESSGQDVMTAALGVALLKLRTH